MQYLAKKKKHYYNINLHFFFFSVSIDHPSGKWTVLLQFLKTIFWKHSFLKYSDK